MKNKGKTHQLGMYIDREKVTNELRESEERHKQAADLLQQTRNNYETFFNTIDDFLFVLDEQGIIIHANSTVYKRLGYTREELSGISVLMIHPPERRDEARRIVGEMLSGVATFCPVPIVTKSGVQIPVETRVTKGLWDGKPVIFGVTKDISRVQLSEEKFSKVFYLNPSACGLSGLDDHKYYEVNEAFYTLFGFNKEEVIGKTAIELEILTTEAINAVMSKADALGNVTNVVTNLKAKNGDIKHVMLSSENIYVQEKGYRFTVVHDITEIKQIEKALRDSSQKFEAIISASPDGIGMVSLDGNIQFLSKQLALMYGYSFDEVDGLIGKSLFGFIDPSNHKRLIDNIQKLIAGKKDQKITEYLALNKENGQFYVGVNSTLLYDSYGYPESILFVERDITDRKKAEDEIQLKNLQLIKANSEKDRFFSILAHDLRGPFHGFLGLTQTMAEDLPNFTAEEVQMFAVSMKNSATNLYRLLENLLEWSLMQQGLIPFNPENMLLLPIVNRSLEVMMAQAKNKGIEIAIDLPNDLKAFADGNMLQAIFRNLVSNAVKFTPKGGKVTLSAKATIDNSVEISIMDTGIGMNKNLIGALFSLDVKTSRNGTEGESSTGLGLLICKDFIEKHGGRIWAESEVGKGATFYFTLK